MFVRFAPLLLALASGCTTPKLVGERAFTPEDPQVKRTVVIEPFFELAETTVSLVTTNQGLGAYPGDPGLPSVPLLSILGVPVSLFGGASASPTGTPTFNRTEMGKPFFAKPETLAELQPRLLAEVQRRRPSWHVTSTSGTQLLDGDVAVVRTVIRGNETVASDPLATVRVFGFMERFHLEASTLQPRLVRYPSQPDFAVNLADVSPLRREFGLDVSCEEGLLADEGPRANVLIDGFIDRLASATIALVEEP